MKKKNGFTLVELIAVISLLAIIALISVPIVNNTIKNSKTKAYNQQVKTIEETAKKWALENTKELPELDGEQIEVSLATLKNSLYLENDVITDPRDDSEMNGCVTITYVSTSNNYTYEYKSTCS